LGSDAEVQVLLLELLVRSILFTGLLRERLERKREAILVGG
jgi:hypothetical protein